MVARTADIPLVEVSGLAVHRDGEGEVLLAVGDRHGSYARARLSPDLPANSGDWEVVDLDETAGRAGASLEQLEAVCADGSGRLVLMQEEPARLVVIDPGGTALVAILQLDASADALLSSVWDRDDNSRGESMVLLPGGRVFIVKEKRPICFAVFGPPHQAQAGSVPGDGSWAAPIVGVDAAVGAMAGPWGGFPAVPADGAAVAATLVATASWPAGKRIERLGDVSDAALGPDGALYLLSDQTASIARIEQLPAPGEKVRPSHTWGIDGAPAKCEGLAFGADGTCYVGVDTRKPRGNLLVLPADAFGL